MTKSIFKRSNIRAYARATTMMSTQSATGFEWSVQLIGSSFAVGIASKLTPDTVIHADQESISLHSTSSFAYFRRGPIIIYSGLRKVQTGDVVGFKFQPDAKKLIINWVRSRDFFIN